MEDLKMKACLRLERQLAALKVDYILRRPDGVVVSHGTVEALNPRPKRGVAQYYCAEFLDPMQPGDSVVIPYTDELPEKELAPAASRTAFATFGKGNFMTARRADGIEVLCLDRDDKNESEENN